MEKSKNSGKIEAAILIQRFIRGYLSRRKFKLKDNQSLLQKDKKIFLTGNDPKFIGLEKFKLKDKRAFVVGTSCLRSLSVALRLGDSLKPPQLIIIDHSPMVVKFWRLLKAFTRTKDNERRFLDAFPAFLEVNKFSRGGVQVWQGAVLGALADYPSFDPNLFFKNMLFSYNYKYLQKIVLNSRILLEDWQNLEVFSKLNNIFNEINLDRKNLFVYVSNIAGVESVDQNKVLQNIHLLRSRMAIFTNMRQLKIINTIIRFPTRYYLCETTHPESVKLHFKLFEYRQGEDELDEKKLKETLMEKQINPQYIDSVVKYFAA